MLILEFCLGHLTKYCKQLKQVYGRVNQPLSMTNISFSLRRCRAISWEWVLYTEAPHPLGPARVCCDDWWATASLIVNFDLDFSICFTFHKSRLSFHLQMEIWKYPTGFCQLSFAWLRFVFTLRVTHFSSGPLDRGEWSRRPTSPDIFWQWIFF